MSKTGKYWWYLFGGSVFQSLVSSFRTRVLADGGTMEADACMATEIQNIGTSFFDSCSFSLLPGGYKTSKLYAIKPTNGSGDLTFTRTTVSNRVNSSGVLASIATHIPAIDYMGVSCPFLSLHPLRTNLLLNSTNLSTQSVTVTNVQHALSFFGTGTITLTGVSTAGPLVGTGANDLVTLLFTPTAGSLTLTVSGTVSYGQLEIGGYATRRIITFGSSGSRNADAITALTDASLVGQTEGTIFCRASSFPDGTTKTLSISDGTANNRIQIAFASIIAAAIVRSGSTVANISFGAFVAGTVYKVAVTYANNYMALFVNGVKIGEDLALTVPTTDRIQFTSGDGTLPFYGNLYNYSISKTRLSDADAILLTT